MQTNHDEPALAGQARVLDFWRSRLNGRAFMLRRDFDIQEIVKELAHVSVLACEEDCLRFRLAGTGLYAAFGCEARGKSAAEIDACRDAAMWTELAARSLARLAPVSGMSRTADGMVHYWLRLPMSSDGVMADQVLCHDRYLPAEALEDLERVASLADRALRRDVHAMVPA